MRERSISVRNQARLAHGTLFLTPVALLAFRLQPSTLAQANNPEISSVRFFRQSQAMFHNG
jgi:hypothetical protein